MIAGWAPCTLCSAVRTSDHPHFVLELVDQLAHRLDFHARLAPCRLAGLGHVEPRRPVASVIVSGLLFDRLLLGFPLLGEGRITRLFWAPLGGTDPRPPTA